MLHSSHPLTFDQAVPSPHNQTRNRRASHFLGAASAAGLQSTVMSPAASPSPARYTPNLPHMQPPPPPQLAPAPVPPPPQPLTQEERDKQLMAAFDVDDTGRRKGGGPMPPPRAPSSSSSESLDDGLKL